MFDFILACLMVTLFVLPFRIWFKVRWHRIPKGVLLAKGYPLSLLAFTRWSEKHPFVSWGVVFPTFNLISTGVLAGLLWLVGLGQVWIYGVFTVIDAVLTHHQLLRTRRM